MPRSATFGAGLLAAVMLAACGGSSHASSSSPAVAPRRPPPPARRPPATSGDRRPCTASTARRRARSAPGPTSTTATSSGQPPEVPKGRRSQHSTGATPSSGVSIPAAFIIQRRGQPAATADRSAQRGDGAAAGASTRTPSRTPSRSRRPAIPRFASSRSGHGTVDVTGLRNGTYRLLVDGRTGARLMIGAVPGP